MCIRQIMEKNAINGLEKDFGTNGMTLRIKQQVRRSDLSPQIRGIICERK